MERGWGIGLGMEAYYGGVDAGGRPLRCGREGRTFAVRALGASYYKKSRHVYTSPETKSSTSPAIGG